MMVKHDATSERRTRREREKKERKKVMKDIEPERESSRGDFGGRLPSFLHRQCVLFRFFFLRPPLSASHETERDQQHF